MNIGAILIEGKQRWQCNLCLTIHEGWDQASDCCCQLSIESLHKEGNEWMRDQRGNVENAEPLTSH